MRKKTITKAQIYRSVASSTAIETGVSVQKIEQQLKLNQAQAKAVGSPADWARYRSLNRYLFPASD